MKYLRHLVGGLAIFGIMITLFMTGLNGIESAYGTPDDLNDPSSSGLSIGESLDGLLILRGLDQLVSVFEPTTPGNQQDIVGSLLTGALGAIRTISGMFTFPFEIGYIILDYYNVPPIIINGLLAIMVVYIAFILISAKLGSDI
jgi:hypothetical protein